MSNNISSRNQWFPMGLREFILGLLITILFTSFTFGFSFVLTKNQLAATIASLLILAVLMFYLKDTV